MSLHQYKKKWKGLDGILIWSTTKIFCELLKKFEHIGRGIKSFYIRALQATGAQPPSPTGSKCTVITLDMRFLGIVIAIFKMWLSLLINPAYAMWWLN